LSALDLKVILLPFTIYLPSTPSSGRLFGLFCRGFRPQLQGVNTAGSIELFLQQSVDHSMAGRLHFGLEGFRDYVQAGACKQLCQGFGVLRGRIGTDLK
jgi:hypothetical protein